ncbi:MAG: glycoside hydrolase family 3 C-terminal domain-containing protein [Elusimicrobia bacterium]|nr:glycoside hydrolase family 3 C-terminal domain-containing protein [Elusimicrobiota bacterium]
MYDIKKEARALVAKMNLREKVSQMIHNSKELKHHNIPSYNWWNEALHGIARAGVSTVFPQAIGLAATFDAELVQKVADTVSTEGRGKFNANQEEGDHDIYKGITYWTPNINIFRDPRWGRGHETYGEDPYLTSLMGVAYIKGLQGPDKNSLKTAACAKHFAVHSGPENDRHHFNAVVDDYDLWNTYLPAFEAAVKEANVEAVMGAYNRTLGEPCCGSELLLKKILRDKWGFDGHVVSDCWAIKDFHENHKVTKGPEESVALAISKGCDINCGNLFPNAVAAVQNGLISEENIDTAVTRLFTTRMRLGLLGAPKNPKYADIPYNVVDCPEHNAFNTEVARRSIVLLKNDGALPLNIKKIKTIGVIGPNADSRKALEGNYMGTPSRHITVLDGVREIAEKAGARVLFSEGCHLFKDRTEGLAQEDDRLSEARAVTKRSDAVIVCLGLDADIEGEESDAFSASQAVGDKPYIELPGRQQKLLENVIAAAGKKPVIVVFVSGSALACVYADEKANGIIQAFYPGANGGRAVAEAIFGLFSPSGKLPLTFYRSTSDLPDFKDYNMTNRTYKYFKGEPLYPFGFGLGYSKFSLKNFKADKDVCSVTVENKGKIPARETVQIYVTSPGQKEIRSLCGIGSVYLKPGEKTELKIKLAKNAFSRFDANGDAKLIKGKHVLHAGFTQPDARSMSLSGGKILTAEIDL